MKPRLLRHSVAAALLALAVLPDGCRGAPRPARQAAQPTQPAAPEPLPPRNIPILCMHDVGPNARNDYSVKTASLEQYLAWLSAQGFRTVTVRDIAAFLDRQATLPEKPVVLSFDDNWKSALTIVKPLLDKHGFVGVAFVMSDNVGAGKRRLTWEDCKALAAAGWEIGSHTRTHEYLTRLSDRARIEEEIRGSKQAIEEATGLAVTSLALPYGLYDTSILERVKAAGYTAALTIDQGVADEQSDPFLLPRRMVVNGTSFATFQRLCRARTLHVTQLDPPAGARVRSTAVSIAGLLADSDVTAAPLGAVRDHRTKVVLDSASRRFTMRAELNPGANAITLSAGDREVSWLIIRER